MLTSEQAATLIHGLYLALDEGRPEDMGACFSQDGVWLRQGQSLAGPEAVADAFAGRPAGLKVAHLISNLCFDRMSGDEMTCRYYMTAYRHDGDDANGPAPSQTPFQIARVRACVALCGGDPKIRRLEITEAVFRA